MSLTDKLQQKIGQAPLSPGCYIFRNKDGKILYVGKALILRDRVKQYFASSKDLLPKTALLVEQIADVEFVVADSETEALVLESNLIKRYKPKYNVLRKDDKNYLWLKLNKEEAFPKFEFVREKQNDAATYFGPYYAGKPIKKTLRLLREIFPYRTCNRKINEVKGKITSSDSKPCLYYFLGLCPAPCAGFIPSKDYFKNINHIENYLLKKIEVVVKKLEEDMVKLSKNQDYEQAAQIRDKINDLKYIAQKVDVEPRTNEHTFRILKSSQKIKALEELIEIIANEELVLRSGFKMECYDISNIQGANAVGSMAVFVDGLPQKRLYRKFKIKSKNTPDDYAMLEEVLHRRFKHLTISEDASFKIPPELIVIDGGKGQLSSAFKVLSELKIKIPVVGLAKKNEDIFKIVDIDGELNFEKKVLPIGSEARFLMQRLRDETHRFGIDYHRKLRQKAQVFSLLSEIPGVGQVLGVKLLKAFGSINGVRKATEAEIYAVVKNKTTVNNIIKLLHTS